MRVRIIEKEIIDKEVLIESGWSFDRIYSATFKGNGNIDINGLEFEKYEVKIIDK